MFNFFKKSKPTVKQIPKSIQMLSVKVTLHSDSVVEMDCRSMKVHKDSEDLLVLRSFKDDRTKMVHGKDVKILEVNKEMVPNPEYKEIL